MEPDFHKLALVKFDPCYYPALAQVLTAAYGNYAFDAEVLRFRDEMIAQTYVIERWSVLWSGTPVAFGEYSQTPEMHQPGAFLINVVVHPNYQQRGFGNCLYEKILADLTTHRPFALRAACRADHARSVTFLERRGFTRRQRFRELHLELTQSGSHTTDARLSESGITIETMQSLATDRDRNRKLYFLIAALRGDVPSPHPVTDVAYEHFVGGFLESPSRLPEATFVAVHKDEYIGFSDLYDDGEGGVLAGLTGVRREYRRQGIAMALKRAGIQYACLHGYNHMKTFNAAENFGITAVNKRLGFTERFEWLHLEKRVSDQ